MTKIIVILALFTSFSFGLDLGAGTSEDISARSEKSRNVSDTTYVSDSTSKAESESESKETSNSLSNTLSKIEQTEPLIVLYSLEQSGVKPFSSCKLLSEPRYPADFGLSCYFKNTKMFNEGRCSSLELAVKNNLSITDFLGKRKAKKIMAYGECVGLYGAVIASSMKTGKTSLSSIDEEIKETLNRYLKNINFNKCKLVGDTSSINCNGSLFKIGYEPQAHFSGISLYSDRTFFGYSSVENKDNSTRTTKSESTSKSKNYQESATLTDSLNNNTSVSGSLQEQVSSGLSVGKFISAE